MDRRPICILVAALLTSCAATAPVTATPSPPSTETNGLSENESLTLWSRDTDTSSEYDGEQPAVRQIAAGTDVTFTQPPATAATWTRNDFENLEAGGSDTSVYPSHASLEDGTFIQDAHATVFAVQPSSRGHLEADDTPLYIAPNGTLRGLVDYRVRVPDGSSSENTTIEWSLTDHEITEVHLKKDDETIMRADGSHTPVIDYQIDEDRRTVLILEANISVRLKKTIQTDVGNSTDVDVVYRDETQTVSDSIAVEIYDLSAYPSYAEYPNGDTGVAIFQSQPWQGYTLTDGGNARVRGVWRFYTARDPNWDTLIRSNRTGSTETESDAIPVYVHAYPSQIGPRAEPVGEGPEIIDTWGINRSSPKETIGETVDVGVVNQSYATTYGVAVRAETVDRESLNVGGIVRGIDASIDEPPAGSERQLRRSNLSVDVLRQNQSQATLRIELRDNQTGDPIVLSGGDRRFPIGGSARSGYISIADQEVETNSSGVAVVTVAEPGIYTARYHPGSWLGHNPAYVSDMATVRWYPLQSTSSQFAFLFEAGWQLIPFFVMFYAGRRLLQMFGPSDTFQRNP